MSASQAAAADQSSPAPSVFNVLGSYADRIKPKDAASTSSSSSTKPFTSRKLSSTPASSRAEEDDGPWETVQAGRQRKEDKEKRGQVHNANTSRDWRERPARTEKRSDRQEEPRAESRSRGSKIGTGGPGGTSSTSGSKKGSSSAPPPASLTEKRAAPSTASHGLGTKSVWGLVSPPSHPTTISSTPSLHDLQPLKPAPSSTVPSSPSLNGTTATATSISMPPSIASPSLSADIASAEAVTVRGSDEEPGDGDEADSWRLQKSEAEHKVQEGKKERKEKKKAEEAEKKPVVPAPPPAVNAWAARKPKLGPSAAHSDDPTSNGHTAATSTGEQTAKPEQPHVESQREEPKQQSQQPKLQFGSLTNGEVLGDVKIGGKAAGKKKKATGGEVTVPVAVGGLGAWPDLAAATVGDKTKEKDGKAPAAVPTPEASTVHGEGEGNSAGGSKKQKWKAIPAAELLAAADEHAESQRRTMAARKRLGRDAPSVSRGRKAGGGRSDDRSTANGIRLPNNVPRGRSALTFGTVGATSTSESGSSGRIGEDGVSVGTGSGNVSAPLSRQTSRQSRSGVVIPSHPPSIASRSSPARASLPLQPTQSQPPATAQLPNGHDVTSSTTASRPMAPHSSAPLPSQPFFPSPGIPQPPHYPLPRPPRGRHDRNSISSGRGRAFRSPSVPFNGGHKFGGGPAAAGVMSPNGGTYQHLPGFMPQGFYPGWHGGNFVPAPGGPAGQGGAGMMMPPPAPMPQTYVPGLDYTRVLMLGQVEYYFSMQNLAMDFFLRQQMDSEGWIDIAMISSFNRIKHITPDVPFVTEVMQLSSLLEVRGDKVRLARGEWRRWVLPDAKPSTVAPDPTPLPPATAQQASSSSAAAPNGGEDSSAGSTAMSPGSTEGGGPSAQDTSVDTGYTTSDEHAALGLDVGYGVGIEMFGSMGMGVFPGAVMPEHGAQRRYGAQEVVNALMKSGRGGAAALPPVEADQDKAGKEETETSIPVDVGAKEEGKEGGR